MNVDEALLIAEALEDRLGRTLKDPTQEELALLCLAEAIKQPRADKLNFAFFEE
jgi:hypothetical protein